MAAPLAAATDPDAVAFLVCVSACGLSPAEQMRIGTAKRLRKAGYSVDDVEDLVQLRLAVEGYLRGTTDRAATQAMLDKAAGRSWFALGCLPPALPEPGSWADMDYDPRPVLARIPCPVLAFYGETDEWMPIEESIDAWHEAQAAGGPADLTVVRLDGADHLPTLGGQPDPAAASPAYAETLTRWVSARQPLRSGQAALS